MGGVPKLGGTTSRNTWPPPAPPVAASSITAPPAVFAVAVVPKTQADDDKLATALHRLQEEDPVLVVERDEETHQTVLRGAGETHLAIALERLERKFGVAVTTDDVKIQIGRAHV